MDWKECAVSDLKKYCSLQESLVSIPEQIHELELRFQTVKGVPTDKVSVQGGESHTEEFMLKNIEKRDRLKYLYDANSRMFKLIDKCLGALSEDERKILECFYISGQKGAVRKLVDELQYEQAQVYRIRDEALYKFTVSMYGIIEY